MWLMQLGEVIFGGVGSGLYGMLVFAIIAVLSLLGIGFVALVSLLERLVIPWHVQHR